MASVYVNEKKEIVSGQSYCYRGRRAALMSSKKATTSPRVLELWDRATNRQCYLGKGVDASWWGRSGIVNVVEV
jgi:hypothetical protein